MELRLQRLHKMTIKPIIPITGAIVGYAATVAYTKRYGGALVVVGTIAGSVLAMAFSSYYFLPKSVEELLKQDKEAKLKK